MTFICRAASAAIFRILIPVALLFAAVSAQSSNQSFPTPVRTNEISGTIRARDIGDARLTTHFYTFNGEQGDIFINVVTKNFDGDIDVFAAETLRPLTKIVVYSDSSDNETGRVVYLRQAQKMILRIEGRTPNDDPATYRIKFAGSFVPSNDLASNDDPKVDDSKRSDDPDVKVNSVGTIVAVKPKPTPKPVEKVVEKPAEKVAKADKTPETATKPDPRPKTQAASKTETRKPEVVVTDELPKTDAEKADRPPAKPKAPANPKLKNPEPKRPESKKPENTAKSEPKKNQPAEPDPLASVRLIVIFKDGSKIERPMNEILRISVDKGTLTIIHKDGSIGKYSILDVARMTIE